MKHYVIGDVRGDLGLMKQMIDTIGPVEGDWVLFTGSMLGPGSNSKGCINEAIKLLQITHFGGPEFVFLVGCYENVMRRAIAEDAEYRWRKLWKDMQGEKVLETYATGVIPKGRKRFSLPFEIPALHIEFLEHEMKLFYKHDELKFIVYHAGPDPFNDLNKPDQEAVVMGIDGWWNCDMANFTHKIIFSHAPQKEPFIRPNVLGIDLGCGLSEHGKLCAYVVEDDRFIIQTKKTLVN